MEMEYRTTSFQLAPGETNVYGDKFSPSLATFYLKGELMCSSTRFVYRIPNTVLGIIPLGSAENTIPLRQMAQVSTSQRLRFGTLIFGLLFTFVSFYQLKDNIAWSLFLLLGLLMLLNCFPYQLVVTNPAGGNTEITVSILEGKKLKAFAAELQNRLYSDLEQGRHDEAQSMRQMQTALQQMQLQQMQQQTFQNQQGFAAQHGQFPQGAPQGQFPQGAPQGQFPQGAPQGQFPQGAPQGQFPQGAPQGQFPPQQPPADGDSKPRG